MVDLFDALPPILVPVHLHHQSQAVDGLFDTGAGPSCITIDLLTNMGLKPTGPPVPVSTADTSPCNNLGTVELEVQLSPDTAVFKDLFIVLPDAHHPVILGRRLLAQMPLSINLNGKHLLHGFGEIRTGNEPPTHQPGEGIRFSGGTQEQQDLVRNLIMNNKQLFFEYTGQYGLLRDYQFKLQTKTGVPVSSKPFRVSPDKAGIMNEIVNEYLSRGLIEHSNSPYSAPAFLVPKHADQDAPASRAFRLVEDYRKVNLDLLDLAYPVPSIDSLLDALGSNNKFFCILDLRQGYHQVPLTLESRELTAFSVPSGLYQYKVLPYGLKTAPRAFQQTMETILRRHLYKRCLVYIDDIIIFGRTFEELLENLEIIFKTLLAAGAALNLQKCKFLATQIKYLGHLIDETGLQPTTEAVDAVQNFPLPQTTRQLRRFLGLSSFVRRYIPKFAEYESRLRRLLHGQSQFAKLKWTNAATDTFEKLKQQISADTHLRRFDPTKPVHIFVDASSVALGAIMCQMDDQECPRVIEFASRTLVNYELRYSNTHRELLAVVWALSEKFKHYTEGRQVHAYTNHKPLTGNIRLTHNSFQLVRLLNKIEHLNYTMHFKPGSAMQAPDALSRLPEFALHNIHVPSANRFQFFRQVHHQYGHVGWKKLLAIIRTTHAWPKMRQDVWRWSQTCPACISFSTPTSKVGGPPLHQQVQSTNEQWAMDFVPMPEASPSRFRKALIGIDLHSKYVSHVPCKKASPAVIDQFLNRLYQQGITPKTVTADRGPTFRSSMTKQLMNRRQIHLHLTSRNHPTGNSTCERVIRTLKESMPKLLPDPNRWPEALAKAVQAYNKVPHSTTGVPPEILQFKQTSEQPQHPVIPRRRLREDPRPRILAGQQVLLVPPRETRIRHAVDRMYHVKRSGPFTVIRQLPFNRFLLSGYQSTLVVPSSHLLPFPSLGPPGERDPL